MNLPIIIQNVVYRKNKKDFEVLMLKRAQNRGGFWNVVNGTLELGESIIQCRERELREETGITKTLGWSDEINRFSFIYKNYTIVVIVFSVAVSPTQTVTINEEHTEFRWMKFDEAISLMKFAEDRQGLEICSRRLTEGGIKY